MKNLLLLAVVLCFGGWMVRPAVAQSVPNAGFETWTTQAGTEYPASWLTTDAIYGGQGIPISLGTVTKSTESYAGSFAAKMESKTLFGLPFPAFLILGSRFLTSSTFGVGGIPYTSRPATLQFWYKLTLAANDSAGVYVALTRGGGQAAQIIGAGATILPARAAYGQISVPISYALGQAPDSLRLFFLCGTGGVAASSALWIDEVALTGSVAAVAPAAVAAALSVYPNPSSSGEFFLASLSHPMLATAPCRVYDSMGRLVFQQQAAPLNAASGRTVDLRGLRAGVYLLHLSTPDGLLTRKLLIP
ncbi:T9SS type A sorting domain-containing protein [Microvirga sp. STR05]|uniref:T9SS type A sorting domain-containing protein n=1 Tax=Hymenobacter duratus TaxID=2771356 RepID=A0ABR8JDK8_9BACT|nr:T9SS type A sorting domain-containing protein [Hymenobacter duratus]MBD2714915.1 T9SS type A sorting domain-containing protein [Hymenobacter duratus]MBR7949821.1 T9SS type A sorting domain-containing protein [Microvirga sp. STR05]